MQKIKVLIVDDSAITRKIFSEELSQYSDIEVIITAPDPFVARDKIINLKPDVIILDIEMPRMDSLTFLRKLMKYYPLPAVIVSSLTSRGVKLTLEALDIGAVDVYPKPGESYAVGDSIQLVNKIRAAFWAKIGKKYIEDHDEKTNEAMKALAQTINKVVAVGSSTGGTDALKILLSQMPPNSPGMVIVHHMPANFTFALAEKLNNTSRLTVKEARNNDSVYPGTALIAPGNYHMLLRRSGVRYFVEIKTGPMVHHQRPSIDVLFKSTAKCAGANSIGVILTGMGADGVAGLLEMKNMGAGTIAQDERTCMVFGIPKEAIKLGAVDNVLPIDQIASEIIRIL